MSCEFVSKHYAKVFVVGGFPYEAFNCKGFISPWNLMKMVEASRISLFKMTGDKSEKDIASYMDMRKLSQSHLLVIASTSTQITPKFYDPSMVKGPVEMKINVDYTGNSAAKLKTFINIPDCNEPICQNSTQLVLLSNQTGLPTPFPDWWKEKYSLGSENGQPLKFARLIVPEKLDLEDYKFRVPASDVDSYLHVSWAYYIRYCHNALVYSYLQKSGMEGVERAHRHLKHFSVSYIKEAGIGDNINVRFWESDKTTDMYHFQLHRDSQLLSECTMEFYPSPA